MVLNVRFSVLHRGVRGMHTQIIRTDAVTLFLRAIQDDVLHSALYREELCPYGRSGQMRSYQSRRLKSLRY